MRCNIFNFYTPHNEHTKCCCRRIILLEQFFSYIKDLMDENKPEEVLPQTHQSHTMENNLKSTQTSNDNRLLENTGDIELYECKKCSDFQTKSFLSFNQHLGDIHANEDLKNTVYHCHACNFAAFSKNLLLRHNLMNGCTNNDKKSDKIGSSSSLRCEVCSFTALEQSSLAVHMLTEHLKPSHEDKKSDKNSIKPRRKYQRKKPLEPREYKCRHCGYQAKWSQQLKKHILRKHTSDDEIEWYYCQYCLRKFKQKEYLKSHLGKRHTKPEDIEWLQCEHCPSKFKGKSDLKSHVHSRHTDPDEIQWFQCEQCPSKFKKKTHLTNHTTSYHTKPEDIRWYECELCAAKFKRKGHQTRHVDLCHSRPEEIEWMECEQCASKFKRKEDLKRHTRLRHARPEEVDWFRCGECEYRAKQKISLQKHVRKVHAAAGARIRVKLGGGGRRRPRDVEGAAARRGEGEKAAGGESAGVEGTRSSF